MNIEELKNGNKKDFKLSEFKKDYPFYPLM
jgi:hypothetical protein